VSAHPGSIKILTNLTADKCKTDGCYDQYPSHAQLLMTI
jgi:hypothetical protein